MILACTVVEFCNRVIRIMTSSELLISLLQIQPGHQYFCLNKYSALQLRCSESVFEYMTLQSTFVNGTVPHIYSNLPKLESHGTPYSN
jgi:hypothetical protein